MSLDEWAWTEAIGAPVFELIASILPACISSMPCKRFRHFLTNFLNNCMSPKRRLIRVSKLDFSSSSDIFVDILVVDAVPNAKAVGKRAAAAAAPTALVLSDKKKTAPATAATLLIVIRTNVILVFRQNDLRT